MCLKFKIIKYLKMFYIGCRMQINSINNIMYVQYVGNQWLKDLKTLCVSKQYVLRSKIWAPTVADWGGAQEHVFM